jgi:hypothetical protein
MSYSFAAIAFVLFEILGYFFIRKKENKTFKLIVIITTIAILSRVTGG